MEPSTLISWTTGAVGALALALALVSRRVRHWPVTEPLLALVLGVALGPQVLGVIELREEVRDVVLLEGSRIMLALSVMTASLRFPVAELRAVRRAIVVLLVVALPLMALISGVAALVVGLPVATALLLGACLAPTDPVLAASVVSGQPAEEQLPDRARQLITAESGANDGLALPLVAMGLLLVLPLDASVELLTLAWQVLGAVAVGLVLGLLVGAGVNRAEQRDDLAHGPALVLTLLLALTTLGLSRLLLLDGVLAVFAAGLAYNRMVGPETRGPEVDVDEAVNRYAVLPLFAILGVVLPWQDWEGIGPALVLLAVLVILLRRLPVLLALARPVGLRLRDAVLVGWFGPMGVSSVFYVMHAREQGADDPRVFAVGTFVIAVSVVVFGFTATPGRVLYHRAVERERARGRTQGRTEGAG